ncbi:MAG: hypothetical protein M1832_005085 [Thelocarpon impressellum]|nr:MAG: hypothetical protein M1832_005085 [Thelocarpon impressellum]
MTSPSTTLPDCPFCAISAANPAPSWPAAPPASSHSSSATAHVVHSTLTTIAFLDILPLAPYHVLLVPRAHVPKLAAASAELAEELGRELRVLCRAVERVLRGSAAAASSVDEEYGGGGVDYNVVQNNGPRAAQTIPHLHFHIVPRLPLDAQSMSAGQPPGLERSMLLFGRGRREELDDEDAAQMVSSLREALRAENEAEKATSGRGKL